MEGVCRVLIIGDTLFSETLEQMFSSLPEVSLVGVVPSLAPALEAVPEIRPHIIVMAADHQTGEAFGQFFMVFPELSIICADLNREYVQVITSRKVGTRRQDLLAAIRSLHCEALAQEDSPSWS